MVSLSGESPCTTVKVKHVLSTFNFSLFGIIVGANRQTCHDGTRGQMSPMAERLSEIVVLNMSNVTDYFLNALRSKFYVLDICYWED